MSLHSLRTLLADWRPRRSRSGNTLQEIIVAWPSLVGENVAAHSAPLELSGDALIVATRSSAWSQQLQFLSEDILRALEPFTQRRPITRLAFRIGALRRARAPAPPLASSRRSGPAAPSLPPEPAADEWEALERLRRRVAALRRRAAAACRRCGAPLEAREPQQCTPCQGVVREERILQAERLFFAAPWLGFSDTAELVAGLQLREYEEARRALLQRWWLVLQRARRAGKLSASELERKVAASYVLLQSRLRPDRVTQAIVVNLLGEELHALLWGRGVSSSKKEGG